MKRHKLTILSSVLIILSLSSCASEAPQQTASSDSRQCSAHFATKGSFVAGRAFTTFEEQPGMKKSVVYEQLVRTFTVKGFGVVSSNKELSVVSVTNPIIIGRGQQATWNGAVSEGQGKTRVDLTFSIPGGSSTSTNALKEEFCDIMSKSFQGT